MANTGGSSVELELDWQAFLSTHDMEWVVKPVHWGEGAFIGNGSMGAMVYGEENAKKRHVLRFVTGRTDVTAARPGAAVRRGASGSFSPRVPIGELALELAGMIYHPTQMRVDLWNAELRALLTTTRGEVKVRALAHSEQEVMAVELETSEAEHEAQFKWYAHAEVDPVLINADGVNLNQYIPEATVERTVADGITLCVQRYETGEGCVTASLGRELAAGRKVIYVSVANGCGDEAKRQAATAVVRAAETEFSRWVDEHRAWWHRYYRQSFVTIPDKRLESFYWIQMYKLASATRSGRPLIDNQGPWLAPTPWAGVWFNMNVQMSYSPVYAANRLELGESLVQAVADNLDNLIANVPERYRADSAGLGRSCSYDLRSDVEDEVGNLTWVCHGLWRHYRSSMDDGLLRDLLYPVLRRSVNYYLHLLEEGEDGRLHLPPTISPEYGSFMLTTVRDCHYDLALLRWGCETLLAAGERLGEHDPLRERWHEVLERLAPLPVDETGWMIGADTPLAYGHRHFSHLLAAFPLHLVGEREEERELIARSLRHWLGKEGDLRGFSWTGAASLAASLGWGDTALRALQTLMLIVQPNTMYKEAGPVIETPLAGAESIHDMLLQSWGGIIRVFPAVPDQWREAAFHDLRAEGAFAVSAVRRGGETQFVRVKSLAGEPCAVRTDWTGDICVSVRSADQSSARVAVCAVDERGLVQVDLRQGEEAVLYRADGPLPDLSIRSVTEAGGPVRSFGGPKPWRLFGFTAGA